MKLDSTAGVQPTSDTRRTNRTQPVRETLTVRLALSVSVVITSITYVLNVIGVLIIQYDNLVLAVVIQESATELQLSGCSAGKMKSHNFFAQKNRCKTNHPLANGCAKKLTRDGNRTYQFAAKIRTAPS